LTVHVAILSPVRSEGLNETGETAPKGHGTAVLDETMHAGTGENNLSAAGHYITYPEFERGNVLYENIHGDFILESSGLLIVAMYFRNRGDDSFGLHFLETIAYPVEHVDTGLLHETDIVRMMGHSHPVTFVVFDFVDIRFNHSDL
jgi:hypothetical protein